MIPRETNFAERLHRKIILLHRNIFIDTGKLTAIHSVMLQCSKIIIVVLTECIDGFIYRRKIAATVAVQGDET